MSFLKIVTNQLTVLCEFKIFKGAAVARNYEEMCRFFGCYTRIPALWVVFSDVIRGMSVTQFIAVGYIARLYFVHFAKCAEII